MNSFKKATLVTTIGIATVISGTLAWLETTQPSPWIETKLEMRLAMIPNYQDINDLPPFEPETPDQAHYDRLSERACDTDNFYAPGSSISEDDKSWMLSYCKTANPIDVTLVCNYTLPGVCLGMEYELKHNPFFKLSERLIINYENRANSIEEIFRIRTEHNLDSKNTLLLGYSFDGFRRSSAIYIPSGKTKPTERITYFWGVGENFHFRPQSYYDRNIFGEQGKPDNWEPPMLLEEWLEDHATEDILKNSTSSMLLGILFNMRPKND